MQITTTSTQATYTKTTQTQVEQTYRSNFSIEEYSLKKPSDISFEEYNNFSYSDLEKIFGDDMEALGEAKFLKRASDYSNDELLNRTMFDKALSLKTKEQRMDMTGMMFFTSGMDKNGNFQIDLSFDAAGRPIINGLGQNGDYPRLNADFNSAEEVMDFLDILIEQFEENFKKGQINNNTAQREFSTSSILLLNDIKQDYIKKEKENEALLNETRRNTNSLNNEKGEKKADLQKLVDDILSLLKTGLTVEEVERLQEMLAEIEKLLAKREEAIDKSELNKEIEKRLKELEDEVMKLQKRVYGEAVMEPDRKVGEAKDDDKAPDPSGFEERTEHIKNVLKKMKEGLINKDSTSPTTQEELQLIQEYKKQTVSVEETEKAV